MLQNKIFVAILVVAMSAGIALKLDQLYFEGVTIAYLVLWLLEATWKKLDPTN